MTAHWFEPPIVVAGCPAVADHFGAEIARFLGRDLDAGCYLTELSADRVSEIMADRGVIVEIREYETVILEMSGLVGAGDGAV